MSCCHKEKMLYGFPEWEVRGLADDLTRINDTKETKPKLYDAAMKLLAKRQTSIGAIIRAARGKKK